MIDREWKDFLKTTASACADCPNRDGDRCEFYKMTLDTMPGFGYIPCSKCEEDCTKEDTP